MSNLVNSPIKNKIGSVFIPVQDIESAREWYCSLLGLPADIPIANGHLCPLPMEGTGLILDTMPKWGGLAPGGAPSVKAPMFMLLTSDLRSSYDYAVRSGINVVSGIEHDHWFVVEDPDGNRVMIAEERTL